MKKRSIFSKKRISRFVKGMSGICLSFVLGISGLQLGTFGTSVVYADETETAYTEIRTIEDLYNIVAPLSA